MFFAWKNTHAVLNTRAAEQTMSRVETSINHDLQCFIDRSASMIPFLMKLQTPSIAETSKKQRNVRLTARQRFLMAARDSTPTANSCPCSVQ